MREQFLFGFKFSIALLLVLFLRYCHQVRMEDQNMAPDNDVVRFELATGTFEVNLNVLEDMRQAMLVFINKPKQEFPARYLESKEFFRQDVELSAAMILDYIPRIGDWVLENDNGELVLVRYPEPSMDGYYTIHALLKYKDSKWEVVSLSTGREFGPEN